MWLRARLAVAKFTAHSWRCATRRATDCQHIFRGDFFHSAQSPAIFSGLDKVLIWEGPSLFSEQ